MSGLIVIATGFLIQKDLERECILTNNQKITLLNVVMSEMTS